MKSFFALYFFEDFSTARRQFFEVRPTNITVKEGQTAILRCTVGNQANVGQTFWTQDGIGLGKIRNNVFYAMVS